MRIQADPVNPGQESVWDYPRPARAELTSRHLQIVHHGIIVAETRRGVRTLETSHPPTYYFPLADVMTGVLRSCSRESFCEWKGEASYFDVIVGDESLLRAAWGYPSPNESFASIANHVAFYAASFEACMVDGERVTPQEVGFYGGWITSHLAGPFKGPPGTVGW